MIRTVAAALIAGPIIMAGSFIGASLAHADSGPSCVDDGMRVCTPANDTHGAPLGCYDDGGVLVAAWPCHVVVNADGSSDVFAP